MDSEKIFLEYVEPYDRGNGMINLKVIHTLRVAEVMDEITKELGLSQKMRELAHICAVFHDIGRFEQIRRFGTFNDSISIDHAQMSCSILQEGNILQELSSGQQEMILAAIRNHSRLAVEEGLQGDTLLLAQLIRDADKCDIFRVFARENMVDTMGKTVEQVVAEYVSEDVKRTIMQAQCVPRAIRKTGLDIWVGFMGLFFDMNFRESIALAKKEGYYRERFDRTRFIHAEAAADVSEILSSVERYIADRLAAGSR